MMLIDRHGNKRNGRLPLWAAWLTLLWVFTLTLFWLTEPGFAEEAEQDATPQTIVESRRISEQFFLGSEFMERSDAQIRATLPPTREYSDSRFNGILTLESFHCEPVYRSEQRQVEREATFVQLSAPDVVLLPMTKEFDLLDGTGPESYRSTTLDYVAVTWSLDGTDADGRPNNYTAVVTYRGMELLPIVDYLQVTAFYQGEIISSTVQPDDPPEAPEPIEPSVPVIDTLASMNIPLGSVSGLEIPWPVVVGAAVVLLLGLFVLIFLLRRRNIRVVEFAAEGQPKTLLRRYGRLVDGTVRLVLPDSVATLAASAELHIMIKSPLAYKQGILEVIAQSQVVLEHPLQPEIELSALVREVLALSAFRSLEVIAG